MHTATTTFAVAEVSLATERLPEVPFRQAIEQHLTAPLLSRLQRLRERLQWSERTIALFRRRDAPVDLTQPMEDSLTSLRQQLALAESFKARNRGTVDACSRYHGQLLAEVSTHPVIAAIHHAFADHRPLCFSPDMIWLLICQGVGHHVNANAESLRSRFVPHQGQVLVKVRRDDFIKGSPENPWGEAVDELSQKVRDHIGPIHDLFLPGFSTTGPMERVAAEIVLLGAMECYFEYVVETRCGIPSITLEGTPEDWQQLADRAKSFATYDLEWWIEWLEPILQEFVAASRGEVRQEFWQSIYKYMERSGGASVSGWIAAFFPYLKADAGNTTVRNTLLAARGHRIDFLEFAAGDRDSDQSEGPSPGDFPSGLSRVPFVWEYHEAKIGMEFLGGFVGIGQDLESVTLRPEIGWAIRQVKPA